MASSALKDKALARGLKALERENKTGWEGWGIGYMNSGGRRNHGPNLNSCSASETFDPKSPHQFEKR